MNRIERVDGFYCDESGERFLQVWRDKANQQEEQKAAVKQVIFWGAVIFVCCALVLAKMHSIGAL